MRLPRIRLRLWHLSTAVAISAPVLAIGVRSPIDAMAVALVTQWLAVPLWASLAILRSLARRPGNDHLPPGTISYLLLGARFYVICLVAYSIPCVVALCLLIAALGLLIGDLGP